MIKACLFDLDGVIVDTAKYHFKAWKRLAYELGIEFTEKDNERLKGVSRIESLDIILDIGGVQLNNSDKQLCADRKNGWFVEYINSMSPDEIFSGAKELLTQCRDRGLKVSLASSSKNAQPVLELLGIRELFDAIVDGTMITNSKPDPEVFLLAASKLGVAPTDCLVFEDAEAGIEAAKRAGMLSVGIGEREILGAADKVVPHIGEFSLSMIDSLTQELSVKKT